MDEYIINFDGKYRFLSNFYPFDGNDKLMEEESAPDKFGMVHYEGIWYPTSEHAYQAAKSTNKNDRFLIAELSTAGQTKRAGRKLDIRDDWDQIKDKVMFDVVYSKFEKSDDLREKLIDTGDAKLVEGNHWHDNYWGVCWCSNCNGKGKNHLGQILMMVRELMKCA